MVVPLEKLNTHEFRKLWDESDADAFVRSFAAFVQKLFFDQAMMCNISVSPTGESVAPMSIIDGRIMNDLTYQNYARSRREARYEADDAMLCKVEKALSFWDNCERHLRYYVSRGWKNWWGNLRKVLIIRRHIRTSSLMLSMQNLWSLAIALYVRKGLGTVENFADRIQTAG